LSLGGVMYHSLNCSTVVIRCVPEWSPTVPSGEKNALFLDGSYTKSLYLLVLRFITAKNSVNLLWSSISRIVFRITSISAVTMLIMNCHREVLQFCFVDKEPT